MATNYPASLDSLTNPSAGDALTSPSHSAQHANANDAIEAVQTELGVNPSGSDATVAARLTAIEAGTNLATGAVTSAKIADDTITATQIAANAVGASELADGAVDAGAIAAGAVTAVKFAAQPGNLLTENQAKPTTTGAYPVDAATEGAAGVYTAVGAGAMTVVTSAPLAATAGESYTALATLSMVGRSASVAVQFLNSGGSAVGGFTQGSIVAAGTTGESRLTVVAPATAVSVNWYVYTGTGSGGDTMTLTKASLHRGAGGQWAMPGTPIIHTGIRPNPSNTAEVQIWNDATATWITV